MSLPTAASISPIALDYLGKQHATLLACGRSANRSFLVGIILNVVYLAYLMGAVSVDAGVAMAGVHLEPSHIVLVAGVHWISTFLLAHGWAAALAEFNLLQAIRRAYHANGIQAVVAGTGMESPLLLPGINLMIAEQFTHVKRVGRFAGVAMQLAFLFATLVLPLVVQGWGVVRAWRLQVGTGWLALLIAAALVALSYVEIAWHHIKRLDDNTFRPELE